MATDDLNQLPPAIHTALCQLVQVLQPCAVPMPTRRPHATEEQACCPACTVTRTAEAIVADAQPPEAPGGGGPFPRSPLEEGVLEVLHILAPIPATTLQVATLLETGAYRQVRTILQALAMLGTIEHPRKGYYRHHRRGR
jgi:hypothetical protein